MQFKVAHDGKSNLLRPNNPRPLKSTTDWCRGCMPVEDLVNFLCKICSRFIFFSFSFLELGITPDWIKPQTTEPAHNSDDEEEERNTER